MVPVAGGGGGGGEVGVVIGEFGVVGGLLGGVDVGPIDV